MIHSHRDEALDLTTFVCEGTMTLEEISGRLRAFYERHPTLNVLWDLGQADLSALRTSDVRTLALSLARQAHVRSGGRTAVVASADLAYGLSRVYQISREIEQNPVDLEVFRTVDEARNWLLGGDRRG